MGHKRTPGLRNRGGIWHINGKMICGVPVHKSTGETTLRGAEAFVAKLANDMRRAIVYGERPRKTWREAVAKYKEVKATKKSLADDVLHLEQLDPFIGHLFLDQVHDGTLQTFKDAQHKPSKTRKHGKKTQSINMALGIVRHILNLASTSWRDEFSGLTWLQTAPRITLDKITDAAKAYPLSEEELRILLQACPNHLANMVLYKVNTGCREQEVCQLQWDWEVPVPELGRSVFLIPEGLVKNTDERLVVLNDVAWSVIEGQRKHRPKIHQEGCGAHEGKTCNCALRYVFTFKGHPLTKINNSAWKTAWRKAGLPVCSEYKRGVHNLKHTFGRRLRAAGVGLETRKVLLGHRNGDITTHYSAPELQELLDASNKANAKPGKNQAVTLLRRKASQGINP